MAASGSTASLIYGSTDPSRTGPWNNPSSVLTASLPCRPCHSRTCATAPSAVHPPCLGDLPPETVFQAALSKL